MVEGDEDRLSRALENAHAALQVGEIYRGAEVALIPARHAEPQPSEPCEEPHDADAVLCGAGSGSTSAPGRMRCRPLTMMRSPGLSPESTMRWPFAVPPSVTSR